MQRGGNNILNDLLKHSKIGSQMMQNEKLNERFYFNAYFFHLDFKYILLSHTYLSVTIYLSPLLSQSVTTREGVLYAVHNGKSLPTDY